MAKTLETTANAATTIPPAAFGPRIAAAIEEFQAGLRDPGYTEEELAEIIREEVETMRAEEREAERPRKAA